MADRPRESQEQRRARKERVKQEAAARNAAASSSQQPQISAPQPIRPDSVQAFLGRTNVPSAASSVSGASVAGPSTGNAPETGQFTGGPIYEEPSATDSAYRESNPSQSSSRVSGTSRLRSSGERSSRRSSRRSSGHGSSHHSRSFSNATTTVNSPTPSQAWVLPPTGQAAYDAQDMGSIYSATPPQQSTPMPPPTPRGFMPQQTSYDEPVYEEQAYGQQPTMPSMGPPPMGPPPMGPPMGAPMGQPSRMPSRPMPGTVSTVSWASDYRAMVAGGTQQSTRPALPLAHPSRGLGHDYYQPGESYTGTTVPAMALIQPPRNLSGGPFYSRNIDRSTSQGGWPPSDSGY
ncbi:hypothetical protein QBC40DRAFT_253795 [Triangularia verruculosa]|uniref:Uncharacterized protein n=1 Tax=Triangularia verruculosa TaxID=2587418 RepID=A0AAN6XIC4_9PEZI|nr:hypothetical protein QBC40DRAFT_253795 [Triangularia verruculosa]